MNNITLKLSLVGENFRVDVNLPGAIRVAAIRPGLVTINRKLEFLDCALSSRTKLNNNKITNQS